MPSHPACGKQWSGTRACHCSGCDQTFSGIKLFDAHRSLAGEHGRCMDPATLVGVELRDGVWSSPPMDDEERAGMTARPRSSGA